MAQAEWENSQSPLKEILPANVLRQVVNDISTASRPTIYPNNVDLPQRLTDRFIQGLVIEAQNAAFVFAQASEVLGIIEEEKFTSLNPAEQHRRIYELSKKELRDGEASEELLKQTYDRYLSTRQGKDSQVAWEKFIQVFKTLNGRFIGKYENRRPRVAANFPVLFPQASIDLPTVSTDLLRFQEGREIYSYTANNELQTRYARQLGILGEEETWVDFLNRANITGSEELKFFPGIFLPVFRNVQTKYPEVMTNIKFQVIDAPGSKGANLGHLLEAKQATPIISLVFPTELLLSS